MENMRPSTIVALIVLVALIFVPAFFININEVPKSNGDLPDANGREAPTAPRPQNPPAKQPDVVPQPNQPHTPRANDVVE